MRTKFGKLVALSLSIVLLLSACGQAAGTSASTAPSSSQAPAEKKVKDPHRLPRCAVRHRRRGAELLVRSGQHPQYDLCFCIREIAGIFSSLNEVFYEP
jgi:hypothetical protein